MDTKAEDNYLKKRSKKKNLYANHPGNMEKNDKVQLRNRAVKM